MDNSKNNIEYYKGKKSMIDSLNFIFDGYFKVLELKNWYSSENIQKETWLSQKDIDIYISWTNHNKTIYYNENSLYIDYWNNLLLSFIYNKDTWWNFNETNSKENFECFLELEAKAYFWKLTEDIIKLTEFNFNNRSSFILKLTEFWFNQIDSVRYSWFSEKNENAWNWVVLKWEQYIYIIYEKALMLRFIEIDWNIELEQSKTNKKNIKLLKEKWYIDSNPEEIINILNKMN